MKDKETCVICECQFAPKEAEQVKCSSCLTLYPKAKNRAEATAQTEKKEQRLTLQMTEKRVRELATEITYKALADAGIRRIPCIKCGTEFFASTPATKTCKNCRTRASRAGEVKIGETEQEVKETKNG